MTKPSTGFALLLFVMLMCFCCGDCGFVAVFPLFYVYVSCLYLMSFKSIFCAIIEHSLSA